MFRNDSAPLKIVIYHLSTLFKQHEIFDYLHVLSNFSKTLNKVCEGTYLKILNSLFQYDTFLQTILRCPESFLIILKVLILIVFKIFKI